MNLGLHHTDTRQRERMNCPRIGAMLVGILAIALGIVGCATPTERRIQRIADKMDQVSRHLEEWGTMSISGPLINQRGEDFRFDLPVSDRELYDTDRTEGAVSVREARAIDVQISARVEALNLLWQLKTESDPKLRDQIKQQLGKTLLAAVGIKSTVADAADAASAVADASAAADADAGAPSSTAAPPPPEPKLVEAPALAPGRASAAVGQFSPMLENYAGAIGMNIQRRINLTANDSRLIGVHEYLSNPNKDLPDGYHAYFFVFTLTIQPGWRTRSGYVGNLDIALHGGWVDPKTGEPALFDIESGDKVEWREPAHFDTVSGHEVDGRDSVDPETQEKVQEYFRIDPKTKEEVVVDEGNVQMYEGYSRIDPKTNKRVIVVETNLEEREFKGAVGLVVGVFPAFNSQELNLRSSYRELITISGQFAAAGQFAGAKIFLEAANRVERDAETSTGLATVTSYSNGLNFGYEFRPAFRALEQPGELEAKPGYRLEPFSFPAVAIVLLPDNWENKPVDLKITFKPTHSWRPVDPPWAKGWPLLNWIGRLFQTRLREVDIVQQSIVLDRQFSELAELGKPIDFHDATDTLNTRWNMLQSLVTHQYPYVTLKAKLSIASLRPTQGFIETDNIFVITGKGLKDAEVAVEGPGVPSDIDKKMTAHVTDNGIVVLIEKNAFKEPQSAFVFRVEARGKTVRTPAFVMKNAPKPPKPPKTASIEIGLEDGKVSSLKIPNADAAVNAEFFQRIVEILKALRPQPDGTQKVDLEVDLKAEKTNP